jgi:hypothetical protein
MADPKQKEAEDRQRQKDDETARRDHRPLGPSESFRHSRGMFPGGRMYGEDDSVVRYFCGHAARITSGTYRFWRIFFKKRPSRTEEPESSIEYQDYDPDA